VRALTLPQPFGLPFDTFVLELTSSAGTGEGASLSSARTALSTGSALEEPELLELLTAYVMHLPQAALKLVRQVPPTSRVEKSLQDRMIEPISSEHASFEWQQTWDEDSNVEWLPNGDLAMLEQDTTVWIVLFVSSAQHTKQTRWFQLLAGGWSGPYIHFGIADASKGLRQSQSSLWQRIVEWRGEPGLGFAPGGSPTGIFIFARAGVSGQPLSGLMEHDPNTAMSWIVQHLESAGARIVETHTDRGAPRRRWVKAASRIDDDRDL